MTAYRVRQFERAAAGYDQASAVQRTLAEILLHLLPPDFSPARGLEIGCGTGHLSGLLLERLPSCRFLFTDPAAPMREACRSNLEKRIREREQGQEGRIPAPFAFLPWDADGKRDPPLPPEVRGEPWPFIASSAVVQWFPDLGAHLRLVESLLEEGGLYLFSSFRQANFPELQALLDEEEGAGAAAGPDGAFTSARVRPGHELGDLDRLLERGKLRLLGGFERDDIRRYPSAEEFFRLLRTLGAGRKPEGRMRSRGSLERLMREYQGRYGEGTGVRATWRYFGALLEKGA